MTKSKEQDPLERLLEEAGELYIEGRLVKAEPKKDREAAPAAAEEGENG